ncbi:hypothetical protein LAZ67_1003912 [Cordylochernes scorpioides]|uniref:RNA-directed DNA polymerase n=1 Tax=Cordylochernes scorpioides TaxID=51811 RepID=A0ABY6JXC7_9ARAC|nr:hypothetical protein LAZ67_1003912 [Cordylochernes scorpioides]
MLENGIIEQSFSPFSSPVTLVTKRDKTKRFCIDYRKVNELISSDVHSLPRIEDILNRLARAKYFSTADISSAYWKVPIHPDSRPLLAFATLEGLYQPTLLPFGLKTSPQIYERAMSQILQRHGLDCVAHYFDDFIVFSDTLEEHQNNLRQFFAFCEVEKLQLNFAKCEFFKQSINFLGYTITAGTTTPLTRNTDIIHAIQQPHNRKTLQSFLGAVNVYNKFIPDYARLRTPLNNLLKKDVTWVWDEKCQKAFTNLKESLTTHPILHLYQEGLPCQVYCDASTLGIAGILKQIHPDGKTYPVQYFSRALHAPLIKSHQPSPPGDSKLTIDHNGLHTISRKGISQMTRLISAQYYWQGMSKDITQKVKTCPTCQLTKRPLGPTYGELGQPPEAKGPFDLLSLDTIAGFAKYGNAKEYLHVVVDHFSRHTWTFPSKSTSIFTYQQVLKRVLQDGSPKRLLTDRAPAFTSPRFRSFPLNRSIHLLLTISNNPQANGLCERLNATPTGKLRLLHLENPKIAWTKLVKRVSTIYNNTPHSITGFPPIYLMFGVLPPELSDHTTPYPDIDRARKIAHTRTQNKHLRDKNVYDQRHKQPRFEIGDLVLMSIHEQRSEIAIGMLWQQFFDARMSSSEDVSSYIAKIENLSARIQDAGGTITDDQKVAKIINSLPSSMRYFIPAWESQAPITQTLENLSARLLIEECRNQQADSSQGTAFYQQTKPRIKEDNIKKTDSGKISELKEKTECHYCHKIGHWSRECRKRIADQQKKNEKRKNQAGDCDHKGFNADTILKWNDCDIWWADSGASCSMTFRREWFKSFTPIHNDHRIYFGDNTSVLAEGTGDIEILAMKNLFSLGVCTEKGYRVDIDKDELRIYSRKDLKAVGQRQDGLYKMMFRVTSSSQGFSAKINNLQLWHERLAHISLTTIREMAKKGLINGLQPEDIKEDDFFCQGCQEGKAHRKPSHLLLKDIGIKMDRLTVLNMDNQAAIKLVQNPEFHKRTKHIDVRYHYIRTKQEDGELITRYVSTLQQTADLLTKPLGPKHFRRLLENLNVMNFKREC